jgi:glycosyltransferase involved in cell wall biosynthesis
MDGMMPLVSCICVTANRRHMINAALESYRSQDWPNKELIVIDDGAQDVRDLCAEVTDCVYIYVAGPQKIGAKRNLACEAASGEIICTFDDDDWSASNRVTDQVSRLLESGKSVSGYHSMLFWDGTRGFKYKGSPDYSLGTALCYRKDFWRRHSFIKEDGRHFEDNAFVQDARTEKEIISVDAEARMVARIHPKNTSPKRPAASPQQWMPQSPNDLPLDFFVAIGGSHAV